jgi:hypothetical protein
MRPIKGLMRLMQAQQERNLKVAVFILEFVSRVDTEHLRSWTSFPQTGCPYLSHPWPPF